jgi:hypothetical protein
MSVCVEFDALFDVPRIQHSLQRVSARRPGERLRSARAAIQNVPCNCSRFRHWSTCRDVIAHTEGCWQDDCADSHHEAKCTAAKPCRSGFFPTKGKMLHKRY